eukprot:2776450-Amphidinium_carterae.1
MQRLHAKHAEGLRFAGPCPKHCHLDARCDLACITRTSPQRTQRLDLPVKSLSLDPAVLGAYCSVQ